jgi:hypothetical protein
MQYCMPTGLMYFLYQKHKSCLKHQTEVALLETGSFHLVLLFEGLPWLGTTDCAKIFKMVYKKSSGLQTLSRIP